MKLLTILDENDLLRFFGMRLDIVDSAIGYTIRDKATGEILQQPPEILMAEKEDRQVRLDKLNSLMVEIDYPEAERDERIIAIARQYRRRQLYFRGRRTGIDYVEYPDPQIERV